MFRAALVFLLIPFMCLADEPPAPDLLPLHEVVKIVGERFEGRLLAARIDEPEPFEFALGTDVVQELVLLSKQGNILKIRLDGVSGRVLDIRGRGLGDARLRDDQNDRKGRD